MDEYLWEYLREFASDLVTLISGIASVVLATIAAFQDKSVPRSAFWISAGVCFVLASYRVWRAKHFAFLRERQANGESERRKRELELQTKQEELVKLQRENRQAAALRGLERLDENVLKLVSEVYADLEAKGSRPGAMYFPPEWIEKAAKELSVDARAVNESLGRLKQAGKLNAVRW